MFAKYKFLMLRLKFWIMCLFILPSLAFQTHASPQAQAPLADQVKPIQVLADSYIKAYFRKDWKELDSLLSDDASFEDPTVKSISSKAMLQKGKVNMLKNFQETYVDLTMQFEQQHAVYSTHYVTVSGQLDLAILVQGRSVRSVLPMTVILKIQDGLVVEHSDYVDYRPYILAMRANRAASAKNNSSDTTKK